jgi:hypothetical protein
MTRTTVRLIAAAICVLPAGQGVRAADEYENEPIRYSRSTPVNRVSRLQERLDGGAAQLKFDAERFGYLPSLLAALEVETDSQTLVFSKTSKQRHRISPRTPRAVYFNDDTYVGYCVDGDVLEISVADPQLGAVFYLLRQEETERPTIVRETDNCLLCHASSRVGGTPGHLVRSLYVDAKGEPMLSEGSHNVDHTTPIADRWGGWYVTGRHGSQRHLGNFVVRDERAPRPYVNHDGQNIDSLTDFIHVKNYLTPHSDLIALMVLEHQALVHNLLTQAGYAAKEALHYEAEFDRAFGEKREGPLESTVGRIRSAGDKLVAGLLFVDEAKLTAPLSGTSSFAARFAAIGPRDRRGRSLREFDLQTRMFRYPCSFLIYSSAFDGLPREMKTYVAGKMLRVLTGEDDDRAYVHLSADDRRAVLEILRETKPDLWPLAKAALRKVDSTVAESNETN